MSLSFRYEARGPSGRIERGGLAARDRDDALVRLHRRKLTPLALTPSSGGQVALRLTDAAARDLARTLAQMLRAGLSLAQALRFASDELAPQAASAAARMREAAEAGDPPSQALDDFAGAEARLLKSVMHAGETSGRLAEALEMAAASFGRSAELRGRLATALIYPSFVILATLATLACFLLVVVPTLAQAFAGSEARLPPSTRALLGFSAWLQADGGLMLITAIALAALAASSANIRHTIAALIDRLVIMPWALGVAPRLEFAAFASLAALSLEAGVPSAAAFDAAASGVRNGAVRANLIRAAAAIRLGERPSAALDRLASPPRSFLRLMVVGEETGRLAEALKQASALLATEAEQRLERLGAVAGPIVTLALGAMVAGVVMSLFLGLLSLSDLAAP